MKHPLPLSAALLLLASCATTSAGPSGPPPKVLSDEAAAAVSPPETELKGYLSAGALDSMKALGAPPASGSPREQADRAIYEQTRALEGTPRWRRAQQDQDLWFGGAVRRYACALGRDISPSATPVTYRLLQRMELDVRTVGAAPKKTYNRTRPLIGNDRPVCIPRADWLKTNASYPSGHSATGWSWGLVLAEAAPSKAAEMIEAGREVGESRIICGAHFQSDVEAGRQLASAMVARLHVEPAFEHDLAVAKRELARAPAMSCAA